MNALHETRIKNANRLTIGHLNINSVQDKFEMLIKDKIGIFLISETKLDSPFPSGQFMSKYYNTTFSLDRNQIGGSLYFTYVVRSHVRFLMNAILKNLSKMFSQKLT